MKVHPHLGTAILFLTLGFIVPAVALQEQGKPDQKQPQQHAQQKSQQKAQPAQQQQKAQQQPAQQHNQQAQPQQHAQQQNQQKAQQQAQQHNQQAQPQQPPQQRANQQRQQQAYHSQEQQHAQQVAWQDHRSQNWQSDHRNWQQPGGYNGYRIRYNGYFGPSYAFVIYNQPYMVVGGFPRFQYGGYWFTLVDPWPNSWDNNWYQTDNVYVVYQNDGYYRYNRRHPSVGIAISVSM